MFHEAEMEISGVDNTVSVMDYEERDDYDIVKYEFTSAPNDVIMNYNRSWVYPFPEGLLNNKFCITIELYVFMVDDDVRAMNNYYEEEREREAENGIIEPLGPPEETYRQEKCVICLEDPPSILYLDCMHIAVCDSCDRMKSKTSLQSTCDVCRAEISKRVKI